MSRPCSAVNQVKSHSCQWGSQVSNVLFRAPYSQLRVDIDRKVMGFNSSQQQAQPRNSAGRMWDLLGRQRGGNEWKSYLGFNESLMNGSQTTAVITQSPRGDTSLAGLRATRWCFTVPSWLLSWTRQGWHILLKREKRAQLRFFIFYLCFWLSDPFTQMYFFQQQRSVSTCETMQPKSTLNIQSHMSNPVDI